MRQIILDTETTGLDPNQGHRVIEIAAVEMVNRRLTGNHFHRYLNPGREIDPGAMQVHGITNEFLQDKPLFRDVVADFLEYVSGAELVIHNAPFDVGFLNSELNLLSTLPGWSGQPCGKISQHCPSVVDTLKLAKELHPGQKNNLDALCRRYMVDNSGRTLHGALLDAELLAEVYLAMTRGQESLAIELNQTRPESAQEEASAVRPTLIVLAATDEELAAHQAQMQSLDKASQGACLWRAMYNQQADQATTELPD
jgi:DNA polymerase III subunit epsilon